MYIYTDIFIFCVEKMKKKKAFLSFSEIKDNGFSVSVELGRDSLATTTASSAVLPSPQKHHTCEQDLFYVLAKNLFLNKTTHVSRIFLCVSKNKIFLS